MTPSFPPITENTFHPEHLMRSWTQNDFLVELYETGHVQYERYGHTSVGYRLYDVEFSRETGNGDPIFQGTDYGIPAGKVIDNLDAVNGIIGFLSCRPGDTDRAYFADYTPRQRAWTHARAEQLSWWAQDDIDMETGAVPEDEQDDPPASYLDGVDGHWYVCRYDRTLPQIHATDCPTCHPEDES